MLLLIDLDNTLIDRTGSFRSWATQWIPAQGGSAEDVSWAIEADRDGYEPRPRLAERIRERLHLAVSPEQMLVDLRAGLVEHLKFDPQVGAALSSAVAAGWSPVVVTNGTVRQQEAKLRRAGFDQLVAGWVISEGAGVRKPDRRIFELGAEAAGLSLADGGWMLGDHPEYDIAGAARAGLQTVWLHLGRPWPEDLPIRPTRIADDCAGAIRGLLHAP
ncbi:HAD family hydrolase [Actinoplanes sp. TFC3]|uniref:HAD family hydrolase n=1 Tax=Actinoplanes sp. TFC3 TaxID=1710355 RepID=UPI0008345F8E|nr:HAD family hydrolase [Actinoplanes sp. TFC3]